MTRASCTKRVGDPAPRADNFGDLMTADHKVLSSTQSPIHSLGTGFGHSMVSIMSVQNQIFSGNRKEFTKASRADRQAKSH